MIVTSAQGPHLLLGRQHLHAGPVEPRLEGELLQVHQRDAQRHRGLVAALGPQVPRRRQRRLRRRRLRAGAGLRRDRAGRRPLVVGQPARSAAARRAARHRRPDPRHRQAPGAPRPRRHLLHQRRRRARPARRGLAAGRRASPSRRSSRAAVQRARARSSPQRSDRPADAQGRRAARRSSATIDADALSLRARRRRRSTARARTATITVKAPTGAQPTDIAGIEAAGAAWWPLAMARELDDAILHHAHQRARDRHLAAEDRGRCAARCSPRRDAARAHRTTGWCARPSACCAARSRGSTCRRARCSRWSSRARASPARWSSSPSPPTAPTCSRCPTTPDARADAHARTSSTSASIPMVNDQTPPAAPLLRREPRRCDAARAAVGKPLDADEALALGLVTAAPDDIDWDDEIRIAHRGARRACRPTR